MVLSLSSVVVERLRLPAVNGNKLFVMFPLLVELDKFITGVVVIFKSWLVNSIDGVLIELVGYCCNGLIDVINDDDDKVLRPPKKLDELIECGLLYTAGVVKCRLLFPSIIGYDATVGWWVWVPKNEEVVDEDNTLEVVTFDKRRGTGLRKPFSVIVLEASREVLPYTGFIFTVLLSLLDEVEEEADKEIFSWLEWDIEWLS